MGEEVRETLSKLHLRLKTTAYSSQGSTVTLTEVTLTGDSPGVCYKFLQLSSGLSFKKKIALFYHFFQMRLFYVLIYFVCGFGKDCIR